MSEKVSLIKYYMAGSTIKDSYNILSEIFIGSELVKHKIERLEVVIEERCIRTLFPHLPDF